MLLPSTRRRPDIHIQILESRCHKCRFKMGKIIAHPRNTSCIGYGTIIHQSGRYFKFLFLSSGKYHLHQDHVKDRTRADAQKRIALQPVEERHRRHGQDLRQAVARSGQIHAL